MKQINLKAILTVAILATTVANTARAGGGESGNGGDPNEMSFKSIATNIEAWIVSGNSKSLSLPDHTSQTQYSSAMISVLHAYHIQFTDKVLLVAGAEKTCLNWKDSSGNQIKCNLGRFASSPVDDKYKLIHHEFAGLAGLEVNTGADSDYTISEQVSANLRDEVVRMLPIVPAARTNPKIPFVSAEPSYRLERYFPRTRQSQKSLSGACEVRDLSAIPKTYFGNFVPALIADFQENTGLKVATFRSATSVSSVTNIRNRSAGEGEETSWKLIKSKAEISVVLQNGTMLEVQLISRMPDLNDETGYFNIGFTTNHALDDIGNPISASCSVVPQLDEVRIVNPKSGKLIYQQASGLVLGNNY